MLNITILDEQEPSVKSADRTKAVQVWSWGNMYKVAITASISENALWIFHARNNPKQQYYLKVVTCSGASFSKNRIYVYEHAA